MRLIARAIAMQCAATSYAGPTNKEMSALSALSLAFVCAYQSPAFRSGTVDRIVGSSKDFAGWDSVDQSSVAQCFRRLNLLSDSLCADLATLSGAEALAGIFDRHRGEASQIVCVCLLN